MYPVPTTNRECIAYALEISKEKGVKHAPMRHHKGINGVHYCAVPLAEISDYIKAGWKFIN
jgi:hypothetical protein